MITNIEHLLSDNLNVSAIIQVLFKLHFSDMLCVLVLLLFKIVHSDPKGAYLHIPFCRRRCFYCDFPIKVIGDRSATQLTQTEAYVELLLKEIDIASVTSASSTFSRQTLSTVYFGGGTPSLLAPVLVDRLLKRLDDKLGLSPDAEITLEMDPGTFDLKKLKSYQLAGVNRVSMGVQSFDQDVLNACGRAHTAQDVDRAIEHLHSAEVSNFSIDLISSLPGVSVKQWRDTLRRAVTTGSSHISVYDLQIEDKTAFGRWYKPGEFPLPSDKQAADMYIAGKETLSAAGYEHYEVSNYAKPGYRSRHNQQYWNCESVWGFGMGAASFVNNIRVTRPSTMGGYREWLSSAAALGYEAAVTTLPGAEEGEMLDRIMLALRTADGLDLTALGEAYGVAVVEKVVAGTREFTGQGLVELRRHGCSDRSVSHMRLTDPQGFLVSNDVISSIFAQF